MSRNKKKTTFPSPKMGAQFDSNMDADKSLVSAYVANCTPTLFGKAQLWRKIINKSKIRYNKQLKEKKMDKYSINLEKYLKETYKDSSFSQCQKYLQNVKLEDLEMKIFGPQDYILVKSLAISEQKNITLHLPKGNEVIISCKEDDAEIDNTQFSTITFNFDPSTGNAAFMKERGKHIPMQDKQQKASSNHHQFLASLLTNIPNHLLENIFTHFNLSLKSERQSNIESLIEAANTNKNLYSSITKTHSDLKDIKDFVDELTTNELDEHVSKYGVTITTTDKDSG